TAAGEPKRAAGHLVGAGQHCQRNLLALTLLSPCSHPASCYHRTWQAVRAFPKDYRTELYRQSSKCLTSLELRHPAHPEPGFCPVVLRCHQVCWMATTPHRRPCARVNDQRERAWGGS